MFETINFVTKKTLILRQNLTILGKIERLQYLSANRTTKVHPVVIKLLIPVSCYRVL